MLAIIGAGFCGTVAAIEFIRTCPVPTKVMIIDEKGVFGPGLAFGHQNDCHVLNVPAGNMSALHQHPDSFLEHCIKRGLDVNSGSFVPRVEYGMYLSSLLGQMITSHSDRVTMQMLKAEVVSVRPQKGEAVLTLANGSELRADHVLLACGNFPPLTPKPLKGLVDDPAYQDAPWGQSATQTSPARLSDSILLIGSGLTALDVISRLAKEGHTGQITLLSRRGLAPQVHRGHSIYAPQHAQATRDLILGVAPTALNYLKTIRGVISKATEIDWRDIIAALRPCTPELWRRLPTGEKHRFLRHVRPYWDNHRHRAAPESNKIFQTMRDAGQVTLLKGRILRVERSGRQFDCDVRLTDTQTVDHIAFDFIINCTGPNVCVTSSPSPLMGQLLNERLMVADDFRLGISLADDFSVLTAENQALPWLSYVGPMLKSRFWEATAVPELRQHVSTHAVHLAAKFSANTRAPS